MPQEVKITRHDGEEFAVGYVPEPEALAGLSPQEIVDELESFMRRAAEKAYREGRVEVRSEVEAFLRRDIRSIF